MRADAKPILNSSHAALRDVDSVRSIADRAKNLLHTVYNNHEKHIHLGSSLSCLDILTTLFVTYVRRDASPIDRDWVILSKGHAAPAYYAVLAELGLIEKEELININDLRSTLQNHPEVGIPGVDASTGSLAQGISFAVGVAAWIRHRGGRGRVFVIMGDGEQDEGQVWEAMTHAAALNLNNIVVIVDWNGCQLDGKTEEVKPKWYLPLVWRVVGWRVLWADGHDVVSLVTALEEALESDRPTVIFAKTSKLAE